MLMEIDEEDESRKGQLKELCQELTGNISAKSCDYLYRTANEKDHMATAERTGKYIIQNFE